MSRKSRYQRSDQPDTAASPSDLAAPRTARSATSPSFPPAWIRFPVSLLLVWHVVGLIVAPMAVSIDMNRGRAVIPGGGAMPPDLRELPASAAAATPVPSGGEWSSTQPSPTGDGPPPGTPVYPQPSALALARIYSPYLDALYLNHGYHFFAPDPAPAHLFEYVVQRREGEPVTGRFPDVDGHWPRLRYHRHFMLAEQVETLAPVPPDSVEPIGAARAYAKHLLRVHDGTRAYLRYIDHKLLTPSQVLDGLPLDAEWTYQFDGDLDEPDTGAASRSGGPAEPIAIPGEPSPVRQP